MTRSIRNISVNIASVIRMCNWAVASRVACLNWSYLEWFGRVSSSFTMAMVASSRHESTLAVCVASYRFTLVLSNID